MYQALPTFPYCKQDKATKHIYEAKCLQMKPAHYLSRHYIALLKVYQNTTITTSLVHFSYGHPKLQVVGHLTLS